MNSSFTIKTPQTSALLGQPSLTLPQKPVLSFSVHETPLSSHLCHGTGRAVSYILSFLSRLPRPRPGRSAQGEGNKPLPRLEAPVPLCASFSSSVKWGGKSLFHRISSFYEGLIIVFFLLFIELIIIKCLAQCLANSKFSVFV